MSKTFVNLHTHETIEITDDEIKKLNSIVCNKGTQHAKVLVELCQIFGNKKVARYPKQFHKFLTDFHKWSMLPSHGFGTNFLRQNDICLFYTRLCNEYGIHAKFWIKDTFGITGLDFDDYIE